MNSQSGTDRFPIKSTKTYYLKGAHARIETTQDLGPMGRHESVTLQDFDSGKVIGLFPDKKRYMTMNVADVAGVADSEIKYELTHTGQKETIAGYQCADWRLMIGGENVETLDLCVARGMGNLISSFPKFYKPEIRAKLQADPNWKEFFEGGVFPLKLKIVDTAGQTVTDDVATSIERKKIDDSLFAVPAGYTEMAKPGASQP